MVMLMDNCVPNFLKRHSHGRHISSSAIVTINGIKLSHQIFIVRYNGPTTTIGQLNQPPAICVKAAVIGHLHSLGSFEDLSTGQEPYPRRDVAVPH